MKKTKTDPTMLSRARELRKTMTPEERKLWHLFLKYYPIRIYRQKIIGPFIADFYCHAAKLIIEIDGTQHYLEEGERYDQQRSHYLKRLGIEVIRFSNYEVNRQFSAVCDRIDGEIQERIEPSPSPAAEKESPSVACGDTSPGGGGKNISTGTLGSPAGGAVREAD